MAGYNLQIAEATIKKILSTLLLREGIPKGDGTGGFSDATAEDLPLNSDDERTVDDVIQSIIDDLSGFVEKSKQATKTSDMTNPVGIGDDGALYVKGGGSAEDISFAFSETYSDGTVGYALKSRITNAQIDSLFE